MGETEEDESNSRDERRPYVKPELTKVGLRPEEAVLGACKASGGTAGGSALGTCSIVACQAQGS